MSSQNRKMLDVKVPTEILSPCHVRLLSCALAFLTHLILSHIRQDQHSNNAPKTLLFFQFHKAQETKSRHLPSPVMAKTTSKPKPNHQRPKARRPFHKLKKSTQRNIQKKQASLAAREERDQDKTQAELKAIRKQQRATAKKSCPLPRREGQPRRHKAGSLNPTFSRR